MNNNVKDALRNYKRYKIRVHILEVIAMFPNKEDSYYRNLAGMSIDKTLMWKATIVDVDLEFQYLITIGYIKYTGKDFCMALTEIGIQALRDCTIQNLALAAYNNYLDLKLKRLTVTISMIAIVISSISLTIGCLKSSETRQIPPCKASDRQTSVIEKDTSCVSPCKPPQTKSYWNSYPYHL